MSFARTYPATLLCALLCLATLALWVQSHAAPRPLDLLNTIGPHAASADGCAYLLYYRPNRPGTMFGGGISGSQSTRIAGHHTVATLSALDYYPNATTVRSGYLLTLPYPTLLALTLPLAALAFWTDHRRRQPLARLHRGLCPACAYDCRASPDRCPECGATLPPNPSRSSPLTTTTPTH